MKNKKKSLLSKTVAVGITVSMMPAIPVHADETSEATEPVPETDDDQILSNNVSANIASAQEAATPSENQPGGVTPDQSAENTSQQVETPVQQQTTPESQPAEAAAAQAETTSASTDPAAPENTVTGENPVQNATENNGIASAQDTQEPAETTPADTASQPADNNPGETTITGAGTEQEVSADEGAEENTDSTSIDNSSESNAVSDAAETDSSVPESDNVTDNANDEEKNNDGSVDDSIREKTDSSGNEDNNPASNAKSNASFGLNEETPLGGNEAENNSESTTPKTKTVNGIVYHVSNGIFVDVNGVPQTVTSADGKTYHVNEEGILVDDNGTPKADEFEEKIPDPVNPGQTVNVKYQYYETEDGLHILKDTKDISPLINTDGQGLDIYMWDWDQRNPGGYTKNGTQETYISWPDAKTHLLTYKQEDDAAKVDQKNWSAKESDYFNKFYDQKYYCVDSDAKDGDTLYTFEANDTSGVQKKYAVWYHDSSQGWIETAVDDLSNDPNYILKVTTQPTKPVEYSSDKNLTEKFVDISNSINSSNPSTVLPVNKEKERLDITESNTTDNYYFLINPDDAGKPVTDLYWMKGIGKKFSCYYYNDGTNENDTAPVGWSIRYVDSPSATGSDHGFYVPILTSNEQEKNSENKKFTGTGKRITDIGVKTVAEAKESLGITDDSKSYYALDNLDSSAENVGKLYSSYTKNGPTYQNHNKAIRTKEGYLFWYYTDGFTGSGSSLKSDDAPLGWSIQCLSENGVKNIANTDHSFYVPILTNEISKINVVNTPIEMTDSLDQSNINNIRNGENKPNIYSLKIENGKLIVYQNGYEQDQNNVSNQKDLYNLFKKLTEGNAYLGKTTVGDNSKQSSDGIASYLKTNYLFKDVDGYWVYDSTQNFASLIPDTLGKVVQNGQTVNFTIYRETGTPLGANSNTSNKPFYYNRGNFLPYDQLDPSKKDNADTYTIYGKKDESENNNSAGRYTLKNGYYNNGTESHTNANESGVNFNFGMLATGKFVQAPGGKYNGKDMIYRFSGDDDMVVYIDDQLVLDLGGTHDALTGEINFARGEVTVNTLTRQAHVSGNNMYTERLTSFPSYTYSFNKVLDKDKLIQKQNSDGTISYVLPDGSIHDIKIFYQERGEGASDLAMTLCLPVTKSGKTSSSVTKEWNDGNNQFKTQTESVRVRLQYLGKDKEWHDYDADISTTNVDPYEAYLSNENHWTYTAVNLDGLSDDILDYRWYEPEVPTGYRSDGYKDEEKSIKDDINKIYSQVYKIINILQAKTSATVDWNDENDKDGLRPKNVVLFLHTVKADGTETIKPVTVRPNINGQWTASETVDRFDKDGRPLKYYWTQADISDYTQSAAYYALGDGTGNRDYESSISNRHTPLKKGTPEDPIDPVSSPENPTDPLPSGNHESGSPSQPVIHTNVNGGQNNPMSAGSEETGPSDNVAIQTKAVPGENPVTTDHSAAAPGKKENKPVKKQNGKRKSVVVDTGDEDDVFGYGFMTIFAGIAAVWAFITRKRRYSG